MQFFILNTPLQEERPNFYCFRDVIALRAQISKVFLPEDSKWIRRVTSNGNYILDCSYKSLEGEIKIEILKTKDERPYVFVLHVFGGIDPLYEVARLCKLNSWSAFNSETMEYLNLDTPPEVSITDSDKKGFYDKYWEKFNKAQEEEDQQKIDLEEIKTTSVSNKKWWKFW